jgi:hypothetical protein
MQLTEVATLPCYRDRLVKRRVKSYGTVSKKWKENPLSISLGECTLQATNIPHLCHFMDCGRKTYFERRKSR